MDTAIAMSRVNVDSGLARPAGGVRGYRHHDWVTVVVLRWQKDRLDSLLPTAVVAWVVLSLGGARSDRVRWSGEDHRTQTFMTSPSMTAARTTVPC